jgi:hypothetical protein
LHPNSYQLAVNNVKAINGDCSNLTPGSTLCLGRTGEDCQTTYVVKTDDTCDGIASAAGINSTILNANNPQINSGCTNIYIGEVCISRFKSKSWKHINILAIGPLHC